MVQYTNENTKMYSFYYSRKSFIIKLSEEKLDDKRVLIYNKLSRL